MAHIGDRNISCACSYSVSAMNIPTAFFTVPGTGRLTTSRPYAGIDREGHKNIDCYHVDFLVLNVDAVTTLEW